MEPLTNSNDIDLSPDVLEVKTIEETIVKDKDITEVQQSPNFKTGVKGWRLNSNGVMEANAGIFSSYSGTFLAGGGETVTVVSGIIVSVA